MSAGKPSPDAMPYATAHLAWKVLFNNLPPETRARWANVIAALDVFFTNEETAHLQSSVLPLLDAALVRVSCGHNDTCGAVLSEAERYPCSCGHDPLLAVVQKARGEW